MYLGNLVIEGYKNFCKPFEIKFSKGLNVLVGENSTGKSAIIDEVYKGSGLNIWHINLKCQMLRPELPTIPKDGSISEQAYENAIKETFRQLDIDVEENEE